MDRITETGILYDIYGGLLTEKKREVIELYWDENLSISEIAEEQGISRAAVHDALRSAEKNLLDYESKLGIAADYLKRKETVAELRNKITELIEKNNQGKNNQNSQIDDREQIEELLSSLEE